MTEEINYLSIRVKKPKKVLWFLAQHLDFFDHSNIISQQKDNSKERIITGNKLGNNFIFLSPCHSTYQNDFNETIVIYTDNCLRDYQKLCIAKVKIEQIPKYTNEGLEVIISDSYGNQYILLEKRNYADI